MNPNGCEPCEPAMNDFVVVKYWVKSPTPHPVTGEIQWVRCTYTDRKIAQAQAHELHDHYNLPLKDDDSLLGSDLI